jgi:hypothetical protein
MAEFNTVQEKKKRFGRLRNKLHYTIQAPLPTTSYDEVFDYIQNKLPGKLVTFTEKLNQIINTGQSFVTEGTKFENEYHDALLHAVDLPGLQELTLSSPDMDELLLRNIKVKEGDSNLDLSNLYVVSRKSSLIEMVGEPTNPVAPSTISDKYRLARLQVIPLTDSIYMSLSKKGGFYVREGALLVPLVLEDAPSYIKSLKKLDNKSYIKDAVKNIHSFNRFVNEMNNGLKSTNDPDDVINSIKIESATPKSTVVFGAGNSTVNYSGSGGSSAFSPKISVGTGQRVSIAPSSGSNLNSSSTVAGDFARLHEDEQGALILGIGRNNSSPFIGITSNDADWMNAYANVRKALPEHEQKFYFPNLFNRDIALTAALTNDTPKEVIGDTSQARNRLIEIARLPYRKKTQAELATINKFFIANNLPTARNFTEAYNTFNANPGVLSRFRDLAKNPEELYEFSPQLHEILDEKSGNSTNYGYSSSGAQKPAQKTNSDNTSSDDIRDLVNTAKSIHPTGNSVIASTQDTLRRLIERWDKLPAKEKEGVMVDALSSARDTFVNTYNIYAANSPGNLKEISDDDVSLDKMLRGIRQFLSTGVFSIEGIAAPNMIEVGGVTGIMDDFSMPIIDATEE